MAALVLAVAWPILVASAPIPASGVVTPSATAGPDLKQQYISIAIHHPLESSTSSPPPPPEPPIAAQRRLFGAHKSRFSEWVDNFKAFRDDSIESMWPYLSETEHLSGWGLLFALLLGATCGFMCLIGCHMCWWATRVELCPRGPLGLPQHERSSYGRYCERTMLPEWTRTVGECRGSFHKEAERFHRRKGLRKCLPCLPRIQWDELPDLQVEVSVWCNALQTRTRACCGVFLTSACGSVFAPLIQCCSGTAAFCTRLGRCVASCCCCCVPAAKQGGEGPSRPKKKEIKEKGSPPRKKNEDAQTLLPKGQPRSDGQRGAGAGGAGGGGMSFTAGVMNVAEWFREVGALATDSAGRRHMIQALSDEVRNVLFDDAKKPPTRGRAGNSGGTVGCHARLPARSPAAHSPA